MGEYFVKLPCEVGDSVWTVYKSINYGYKKIREHTVVNIFYSATKGIKLQLCDTYGTFKPSEVYFSKAEAEKSIKEG